MPRSALCDPLALGLIALTVLASREGFGQAETDRSGEPPDEPIDAFVEDLMELDLEELMEVRVTSVAGREQALLDSPAAISVITNEDVRRTGHRSLADSLRLVPGFTVGQITPSKWAVGSRGFAERFSTQLLVLIDGRTVYDPLFSGVFWQVQDVLLEDLDRIEVIRGPGATLWGANAVNGVVNVTTRSARDTQGLFVQGGGGNEFQGFGAIRYGGQIDENTHFRVYTKYDNYAAWDDITGSTAPSDWDMVRGGFRFDIDGEDDVVFTLQGDAYATGHVDDDVRIPVPGNLTFDRTTYNEQYQGGNVLFRAGQITRPEEGWAVQAYYDRTKTRGGLPDFEVRRDTIDLDYRQYLSCGEDDRHVLMWGLGYRHTDDRTSRGRYINFDPRSRSLDTFSGFIQDTWTLVPDRLAVMFGSKLEHNDFTGFEFQPSGRLLWTPDERQAIWGAVSRAVRTPSRVSDDIRLLTAFVDPPPPGDPVPLIIAGDDSVDAEELIAYELGYRTRLTDDVTLDLAAFYNHYDDLLTLPGPVPAGRIGNRGEADTYGFELSSTWDVTDGWRLAASYAFIKIDFESVDGNAEEGETPQQQFNLRSFLDVTDDIELNTALYFVDNIPALDVDSYVRLDVGVTWRPAPHVEIAVWGQNLLDGEHPEFSDDFFQAVPLEVPRSVYAQVSLRF